MSVDLKKALSMTSKEYRVRTEEYEGICLKCGESRYQCEPDAEQYECESCGKNTVYGIEQLMIMGRIFLN
jgi:hypothetical protein